MCVQLYCTAVAVVVAAVIIVVDAAAAFLPRMSSRIVCVRTDPYLFTFLCMHAHGNCASLFQFQRIFSPSRVVHIRREITNL